MTSWPAVRSARAVAAMVAASGMSARRFASGGKIMPDASKGECPVPAGTALGRSLLFVKKQD
jgi:hypothetical protein